MDIADRMALMLARHDAPPSMLRWRLGKDTFDELRARVHRVGKSIGPIQPQMEYEPRSGVHRLMGVVIDIDNADPGALALECTSEHIWRED